MKDRFFKSLFNSHSKSTKNDEKTNVMKIHLILIENQQKMMKTQKF